MSRLLPPNLKMPTYDEGIPSSSHAFCAGYSEDALALISEASMLEHRLQTFVAFECGLIWAAVRSVHRGEAICNALRGLDPRSVEDEYASDWSSAEPDRLEARIELSQCYNALNVLPYRCEPCDCPLDWRGPVTASDLLAAIIRKGEFEMSSNAPFWAARMDPRDVYCSLLREEGAFTPGVALMRRGRVPEARVRLMQRACEWAAYVGSWIITAPVARAAVLESGSEDDATRIGSDTTEWERMVEKARQHARGEFCKFLVSFPGMRPWTMPAAQILGLSWLSDK